MKFDFIVLGEIVITVSCAIPEQGNSNSNAILMNDLIQVI